jgi:hypothetical protein
MLQPGGKVLAGYEIGVPELCLSAMDGHFGNPATLVKDLKARTTNLAVIVCGIFVAKS